MSRKTAYRRPARAKKSIDGWDEAIAQAKKRGTFDRLLGRFLVTNWRIIAPIVIWVVAQIIGYNTMRVELAATKKQVDVIYRVILWGQRPNVGPPPPVTPEEP